LSGRGSKALDGEVSTSLSKYGANASKYFGNLSIAPAANEEAATSHSFGNDTSSVPTVVGCHSERAAATQT